MKKKSQKVVIILFVIIIFLNSSAFTSKAYSISRVFTDAQDFLDSGDYVGSVIDTDALKDTSSFIYKLLYSIGMVVAVAVGIVLGIQFMVASAEDKAKVKEALIAYVIGCIVLFGAYQIWVRVTKLVQKTTTISISVHEEISIS